MNSIFDANILFEGQRLYGVGMHEVLTVHTLKGYLYRYDLQAEGNTLRISSLNGKPLAEIIAVENDDILVMVRDSYQYSCNVINIIAATEEGIDIEMTYEGKVNIFTV